MLTQQSLENAFIHLPIHLIIHLLSHYILSSCYVLGTKGKKMKEQTYFKEDTAWNLAETKH